MSPAFQTVAAVKESSGTAATPRRWFSRFQSTHGSPNKNVPSRPAMVLEALEQNRPIYYFGLGSNMSRKKLENRGLNGTKIEVLSMQAAVVPNYRLAFNMRGFPPLEPGMGSLEPTDSASKPLLAYRGGTECHGALIRLDAENYEKVMRSEGVGSGQGDQGYEEIVVDAYPYDQQGRSTVDGPVQAVALRARPHVRLGFDPSPSQRYMNLLKEGAKELGLRDCYQEFLEHHPVQRLSQWQRKLALYNLLFTFTLSRRLKFRGWSKLQSRLLFAIYVPGRVEELHCGADDKSGTVLSPCEELSGNPHPLQCFVSTALTAGILLPGSMVGFVWMQALRLVGKEPPSVWTRLSAMTSESATGTAQQAPDSGN